MKKIIIKSSKVKKNSCLLVHDQISFHSSGPRPGHLQMFFSVRENMADKASKPPPIGGNKPVPMKLFATWEVDRTPPNCIPR